MGSGGQGQQWGGGQQMQGTPPATQFGGGQMNGTPPSQQISGNAPTQGQSQPPLTMNPFTGGNSMFNPTMNGTPPSMQVNGPPQQNQGAPTQMNGSPIVQQQFGQMPPINGTPPSQQITGAPSGQSSMPGQMSPGGNVGGPPSQQMNNGMNAFNQAQINQIAGVPPYHQMPIPGVGSPPINGTPPSQPIHQMTPQEQAAQPGMPHWGQVQALNISRPNGNNTYG